MKSVAFRLWILVLLVVSSGVVAQARPVNFDSEAAKGPQTLAAKPITATAYVLMDLETGRILAEKNAHQRMFPASTTKTMTALVAVSQGDLDRVVTIGPNPPKTGESSVYLKQGEKLTLRDLVRAALIKSANDSCVAIAEGVAGNVPAFVKLMNAKAKELGARDTHFANPHGLHDASHYTTAYDLALIGRAALKYPFFNRTIKTQKVFIPGPIKTKGPRLLVNHNRLLFRWPECDGVKTGYTKQAGKCLIASATRVDPVTKKPWRLLSVVMHANDSWSDSAQLLLHQGFEKFAPVEVIGRGQQAAKFAARGGAFETQAVTTRPVRLPLSVQERANLSQKAQLLKLAAPINKGQIVGTLEFSSLGRRVAQVPLVARDAVPVSLVTRLAPGFGRQLPVEAAARDSLLLGIIGAVCFGLAGLLIARKLRRFKSSKARHGSQFSVRQTGIPQSNSASSDSANANSARHSNGQDNTARQNRAAPVQSSQTDAPEHRVGATQSISGNGQSAAQIRDSKARLEQLRAQTNAQATQDRPDN